MASMCMAAREPAATMASASTSGSAAALTAVRQTMPVAALMAAVAEAA